MSEITIEDIQANPALAQQLISLLQSLNSQQPVPVPEPIIEEPVIEKPVQTTAQVFQQLNEEYMELCRTGTVDQIKAFAEEKGFAYARFDVSSQAIRDSLKRKCKAIASHFFEKKYKTTSKVLEGLIVESIETEDFVTACEYIGLFTKMSVRQSKRICKLACQKKAIEVVRSLIPHLTTNVLRTDLCRAVVSGDNELLVSLLEIFGRVRVNSGYMIKRYNRGLLIVAAAVNNYEAFEILLQRDIEAKSRPSRFMYYNFINNSISRPAGCKLFQLCCENPDKRFANALVDKVKDVLRVDDSYRQCLITAIRNNQTSVTKLFVSKHSFDNPKELFEAVSENSNSDVLGLLVSKYGPEAVSGFNNEKLRAATRQYYLNLAEKFA